MQDLRKKLDLQFFAEGEGEASGAAEGNDPGADAETLESLKTALAEERAAKARDKAALDKALKQVGDLTKQLRSKQSQQEIEDEQMQKEIRPLVPEDIWQELEFFIQDEFSSKICIDGKLFKVSSDEINQRYNEDKYSPIDGELIRGCDHLSAYLEAYMSMKYGINSEQIQQGYHNIFQKYEKRTIASVDFGQMFDYFRL